jgi:CubicO group peptidase (beta-lactamase class C family)
MSPDSHNPPEGQGPPDKFQQAWQTQANRSRITVDANLLTDMVQRNQRDFRATIFRRDCLEIGVGLIMLPCWFYLGASGTLPWTWYLTVPAIIWVIGFILVDRRRHPQKPIEPGAPLLASAQESLTQLEHQIWLLRNVFWWYLLPFTVSILAFFAHVSLQELVPAEGWLATLAQLGSFVFLSAILFFVYGFIYWLNQYAVRKQLEPRRQELLKLLKALQDDGTGEASGDFPILMNDDLAPCQPSPRRRLFAILCAVAILLASLAAAFALYNFDHLAQVASEKSPFAAVRWRESEPEVKLGDEWFHLESLDEIPTADILAHSKRTCEGLWRKLFEEDLVALLTGMGHVPKDTVQLVVTPLGSNERKTLENVPMTWANRQAIWNAAYARDRKEQEGPTRGSVYTDDAEAPLTKLVIRLRKEQDLVGLAAMVMVDGQVAASAADGERKKGSGVWVDVRDQWHLGAIAKPITATMLARLVDSGKMKWSSTVGEVFPEESIHDDWKPVTLELLLKHTAGAPVNFSEDVKRQRPALGPECVAARLKAVLDVIAKKPITPPGKKYEYSNVDISIAVAMAEKLTGLAWEDLVKHEVFEPLELSDSGFGPPKSSDEKLEQPRGHLSFGRDRISAYDDVDNTPIIAPAVSGHMSLANLCAFGQDHMLGQLGKGKLLSADIYKRRFLFGWLKKDPTNECHYSVFSHNGANTMWYALVTFIPEKNMVIAVASNDGDLVKAESAAWEIVRFSAEQFTLAAKPQ